MAQVIKGRRQNMRAMMLYNPSAGMGEHHAGDLVAALAEKGIATTCCSVDDPAYPECLAQDADVLIVAGGDGTIYKAVAQLSDRRMPLAIIPLGGANNIATSLGFARDTVLTVAWPRDATLQPFHVGKVRGSSEDGTFVEGVGFGALAASIDRNAPAPGSIREKILNGRRALATALAEAEPVDIDLIVDGQRITGQWLMAEVLTMTHSGPRLPFTSRPHAFDSRFGVVLLEEGKRLEMLEWLNEPERSPPPVRVLPARNVSFRTDGRMPLRIDDDIETVRDRPINLFIDDEPLHVLLPAEPNRKGD